MYFFSWISRAEKETPSSSAQIQPFLQLLKVVLPLAVVFPVKAGRIVKRVCPVDKNMADFMGKNKPPAAVFDRPL